METLQIKGNNDIYPKLLILCPELKYKDKPKDRDFFFNVLNTMKEGTIDKIVYNARLQRV